MQYLGNEKGGRYFPANRLQEGMTLFSFGVGEDISFEVEAANRGVKVYCFDPTPRSIEFIKETNPPVEFYPWGLSNTTGEEKFFYPKDPTHVSCSIDNIQKTSDYFVGQVKCLGDIVEELGVLPDIIKMDIEGREYDVIDDLSFSQYPPILMVQFHGNKDTEEFVNWLVNHVYENVHRTETDYLFL